MLEHIIKAEFNLRAVKEHRFHDTRRWRFDYAIPSEKIAIEVEGGIWLRNEKQSRHTRGSGFVKDMEKYNTATAMGWKLIRIVPGDYASAVNYIGMILNR